MPPSPPQGPFVLSFLLFLLFLPLLPFFCAAVPPRFRPAPARLEPSFGRLPPWRNARELLLRKFNFVCPAPDNASYTGRYPVCGVTAAGRAVIPWRGSWANRSSTKLIISASVGAVDRCKG